MTARNTNLPTGNRAAGVYIQNPQHTMIWGDSMPNNDDQKQMINSLLSMLSDQDKKTLESILADKTATQRILSTPEAQQLMQKMKGGKIDK